MGLDIWVAARPDKVLENYELEDQPELKRLFKEACVALGLASDQEISTRPGSYSGIHRVRTAYAKMKGIDTGEDHAEWQRKDDVLPDSHLVHHSDCDGYYLPSDFIKPIRADQDGNGCVSIGSSVRLLAELRELDRAKLEEYTQRAWDAVFVPAVASVFMRRVIYFG